MDWNNKRRERLEESEGAGQAKGGSDSTRPPVMPEGTGKERRGEAGGRRGGARERVKERAKEREKEKRQRDSTEELQNCWC